MTQGFTVGKTVESEIDVVESDMTRDQFADGKAALTVPIDESWDVVSADTRTEVPSLNRHSLRNQGALAGTSVWTPGVTG